MNLAAVLDQFVGAELLQPVYEEEPGYTFKHALLQEATYDSLLKNDRKRLHQIVGQALERIYSDRLDEYSPILARHFCEAADDQRALRYEVLAGERATQHYARREAVAHFASALGIAPRVGAPLAKLYRARGLAYEALGDYDQARSDQEAALQAARNSLDRRAEWQALIDLGKLWSERDYEKTGEYFRQAYDLARIIDDPAILGESLNRIGNWYVNVERPIEALRSHREALAILQKVDDRRGVAETLDLLGMATTLGGDLIQSASYYRQAIALFREFGEPVSLASSLTAMALGGAEYQSISVVLPETNLDEMQSKVEEALQIAREVGWRSAVAFALIALAGIQGSRGDFTQSLNSGRTALTISEEIGHKQWMTYAHGMLGEIYANLFVAPDALRHLERGLVLAREIGSWHWIRTLSGFLASEYVRLNELGRAQAVIDASVGPEDPPQTIGQRSVYCARVDLELARGAPERALEITDQLIALSAHADGTDGRNILAISVRRGRAFNALGRLAESEASFVASHEVATAQGALPMVWEIDAALAGVYRLQGRAVEADQARQDARSIVDRLAEKIEEEALRNAFVQGARRAGGLDL